ncbi:membrane protein [Alsobacter metallidurans]|uniref:Membrane protein n=1 Tax=Alsobacter metallidurans TaxID=340221 RepID=A0A917I4Q8_9HYPH|nr:AbrB family transcriptional regulator [Alsobacter metallidurans]GGH10409.1 membrane protein [Alsobacter metallidurans]
MNSAAGPNFRAILGQIGLIAAAAGGGWLCDLAGIPAPWLTGAMLATAALSAAHLVPPMVTPIREFALVISGMSMGAAVTPESLGAFAAYPASLAILLVTIFAVVAASAAVLVLLSGWTLPDAVLASAPGALSTVLVIAADRGADVPKIVVVQLLRLFVLVAILPMVIVFAEHGQAGAPIVRAAADAPGLAIFFAVSLAGAMLFERFRVAGAFILGPMVATALVTGPGLIHGGVPPIFSLIGFLLIGVFIGQRFSGLEGMTVLRTAPAAVISFAASLAMSALGAVLVTWSVGVPFGETAVAFAPGGLEAMTVIAFALGLDPVYVGVHHLARFLLIGFLIPAAFKWLPFMQLPENGASAPAAKEPFGPGERP